MMNRKSDNCKADCQSAVAGVVTQQESIQYEVLGPVPFLHDFTKS